MKKILIIVFLLCLVQIAPAQQSLNPGNFVYSLPRTDFHIVAEALCDHFVPGPYAAFSSKYLGVDASVEPFVQYNLQSIELQSCIEADPKHIYQLNVAALKGLDISLFKLSSQGLILLADATETKDARWRFTPEVEAITDAGKVENLTSKNTVLYRQSLQSGEVKEVPVAQSQVVEKPLEQRAEEAARMIFQAREQRMAIVTGNTDADFSGEAMATALEELRRIESEYMSLFTGKHLYGKQVVAFDVIPNPDQKKQVYVAFRISDTEGLLSADCLEGRPIMLDLAYETPVEEMPTLTEPASGAFYYRQAAIMKIRLSDGSLNLLESRTPVYQMGSLLSFPTTKK